ncbi:hypothetical protein HIM_08446 [Hirsutella minnesotensis 3608]|uniref:ATPase AAA-type core domain-containing protein n=1 Tax=Hirsutella minnesotensis 3608 TaxID=1043627 RepID=A0A0F7ZH81_9HYPO|nr:hypothetical protein HIM_08446 [Hirsutella minnesotensis 3608]
MSFQKRISTGEGKPRGHFLKAADFDEEYGRAEHTETNVASLGSSLEALTLIRKRRFPPAFCFAGLQALARRRQPGKWAKCTSYCDMGILSEAKVVECSASEPIGQYVGHAGPKVKGMLDKAPGKILFIDEAYRLAEGAFATGAVDELVDSMTKAKCQGKMIVILAGYVEDIIVFHRSILE